MNLSARLIVMNFLQFFVWGAWLLTLGAYWFNNKHWSGAHFGAVFSTMGIAAIVTPPILGVIADKWVNAEKLYGILHLGGAVALFSLPQVSSPTVFFWVLLLNMLCYMPSLSLAITVAFNALKNAGKDTVVSFPPIRVWGTVGFIAALHTVSLLKLETSAGQFYIAGTAAIILGFYAFTLPSCPPKLDHAHSTTFADRFGLTAFTLFRHRKMAVFFLFSMLLGGALQLTNAYGDTFLHDFANVDAYKHLFAVEHPAIIMSISQISETLFILAIPFFLRRFGIKTVMLMSMVAWTLRFGLFAYGNPGDGLWMIVLSCIVYGMAFDFFNVSGQLFVEDQCEPAIRASAQGLFMLMTNGLGAMLGSLISGAVIEYFFTYPDGGKDWHGIWLSFAAYTAVVAVAFFVLFRHKRGDGISGDPETPWKADRYRGGVTISSPDSTASLPVEGIWNFRDVGGADSPVTIRPGVLFRSSELSGLTPAGAATLRALGVTDLYDLRSPTEIERTGSDRVDGGIRVHEVPFATPAPGEERAPHEVAYRQMMIESATSGRGPDPSLQVEFMLAEYRRFVELPGTLVALKTVANQIASGATALVHCAAGKDRTGFLVGVVLHTVGIDYADIAADYLLSNAAIGAMRAHISAQMDAAEPELAQTMAAMLSDEVLGVREEYLETGFRQVADVFGSPESMLKASGIDGDGLTRLRAALT